jgi:hypothetical protein
VILLIELAHTSPFNSLSGSKGREEKEGEKHVHTVSIPSIHLLASDRRNPLACIALSSIP